MAINQNYKYKSIIIIIKDKKTQLFQISTKLQIMSLSQYTTQEDTLSQYTMPYVRPNKRARTDRRYGKNRNKVYIPRKIRRRLGSVRINDNATHTLMPPLPLGDPTKTVQLMYSSGILTVQADVSGAFAYVFRGNGPYDPDYTSTGQQPKFWDAFSALYYEYFVKASEIEIVMSPNTTSTGPGQVVLCPASGIAGPANSVRTLSESPYACSSMINAAAAETFRLNGYMTTYSMLGIDGNNSADIALTSANPNADASWYWNVAGQIDSLGYVNMTVRIKYTIEFRNLKWDIAS